MNENSTSEELVQLPIEEQISQELVKANVTEAIIADLRERLLPLKIAGIEDKETYLIVQSGRKECKALRVAAKKICTNGREQAVAISKAWIAKEKDVTGRIAEVEDYLEKQEKEFDAEVAKEKEARKRKQEEQLIVRQQTLTNMGALYSDGSFTLGEVSFEFSLIKESEEDIWEETILPKFKAEYEKTQAEQIEKDRLKAEAEAELKRQKEELEQKQKELNDKETQLNLEAERQANEARKAMEDKELARMKQLLDLGLKFDFVDHYKGYNCFVPILDLRFHDDAKWNKLIEEVTAQVDRKKAEESEEKRKEQVKADLQAKRYAELLPYSKYGEPVEMSNLWIHAESGFQEILSEKMGAFEKAEEDRKKQIEEGAAKKERERIEEEQRQENERKITALGELRMHVLVGYNSGGDRTVKELGVMSDGSWDTLRAVHQNAHAEVIRKQEEERKAEEAAKASEKVKWAAIISQLSEIEIPKFISGQYAKRAAILREKLEEIKAL